MKHMHKHELVGIVSLTVALLLAACVQTPASTLPSPTTSPTSAMTTGSAATATPMAGHDHGVVGDPSLPFDAMFIDSMIEHHQGAIGMAELALDQAEREELRTLAEAIIATQTAEIEQLQAWRSAWYPDLAPTGGMQMAMGDMLIREDASVPFDQRFMEAMISHHEGAIHMAELVLDQAEHEEIRTLAEAIIAAQTAEIEEMQRWLRAGYGAQLPVSAVAAVAGTVWVANEAGNSLTAVDAATGAVVATLTGIPSPHNLQVAPDGMTVWAVSGHEKLAVAVDVQSYTLRGVAPVGSTPAHVVVSPDGTTVYVSNSGDNTVTVLEAATMTTQATIPVGDFPHGLRVSPDGRSVAVANLRSNTVSLIDTATLTVAATLEVGAGPVQVAYAPDGATLYVTLNGENAVAAVDLTTGMFKGKGAVGMGPVQVYVTPDGSVVLVANQGTQEAPSTTLSLVDAATLATVGTVETGRGAHGVVVEPSGRYAYVTNLYGNDLAVVDLEARRVIATAPTGEAPNGVSFSPIVSPAAPAREVMLPLPVHAEEDEGEEGTMGGHDQHH